MRVNKILSRSGLCSRRAADSLIEDGRVRVNGVVVEKGTVVDVKTATVEVINQKGVAQKINMSSVVAEPRLWMHNKEKGVLVTASDPDGRPCLIPELARHLGLSHLIPVGRLDMSSEGLILLTDDGDLASHLMHPRQGIPRYYRLRVRGQVDENRLKSLSEGITVRGVHYEPMEAKLMSAQTGSNAWISVKLREGKNRELRNIFEYGLRLTVTRLVRIGYGPYRLPRSLASGETIEVENLFRSHT